VALFFDQQADEDKMINAKIQDLTPLSFSYSIDYKAHKGLLKPEGKRP